MEIQQVLNELDTLFANRKLDQIEEFLQGKLKAALEEQDVESSITITNELIGFYRDMSQYEKADFYCEQVIAVMENRGLKGTVPYATTLLNVANAYRAGGRLEESLSHFRTVKAIYDRTLEPDDFRFASLYNNLSLLYQEMQEFEKSCDCLKKALPIVMQYDYARMELAVTYTNLAASLLRCERHEEAMDCLHKAIAIFEETEEKDYHYSAALSTMGEARFRAEQYEAAVFYYQKALEEIEKNVGRTTAYQRTRENLEQVYRVMDKNNTGGVSGLELSRLYYEAYGKPMIATRFADYQGRIAVGLVGEGSECFGFDDVHSRDHDFGPGFCMWVTQETYEEIGERLQQVYDCLPDEFMGVKRINVIQGRQRTGVWEIGKFYEYLIGTPTAPQQEADWIVIPEDRLATAVNGEVFADSEGKFTEIRNQLNAYYPETLRKKKIAQEAALMAQSGQYNYARMRNRGEDVAAQLAFFEFVSHTMQMTYLLNRKYAPYYKWMHRGMRSFECLPGLWEELRQLCRLTRFEEICMKIEKIVSLVVTELNEQNLSQSRDNYLDRHTGFLLQDRTGEKGVKHSKEELVEQIVRLEWEAFDKVENEGGRADCQNDFATFSLMRKSQYLAWYEELLESYLQDFREANARGENLITEKYAWMMESTVPEKFAVLKETLPKQDPQKITIMEEIIRIQIGWMEGFVQEFPKLAQQARGIYTKEDTAYSTSYETYLRGELRTYSDRTLYLYGQFLVGLAKDGENLAKRIMENTVKLYGYVSLEDAEKKM